MSTRWIIGTEDVLVGLESRVSVLVSTGVDVIGFFIYGQGWKNCVSDTDRIHPPMLSCSSPRYGTCVRHLIGPTCECWFSRWSAPYLQEIGAIIPRHSVAGMDDNDINTSVVVNVVDWAVAVNISRCCYDGAEIFVHPNNWKRSVSSVSLRNFIASCIWSCGVLLDIIEEYLSKRW